MALKPCHECKKEISTEAEKCPNCGATNRNLSGPRSVAALLSGIGGLVLIYLSLQLLTGGSLPNLGILDGLTATVQGPPVITMAEFNQLKEGMSYNEATRIIGAAGEEVSRSSILGITTVMYSWTNPDYSNANAMFQNSSLVSKAQAGLK